MGKENDVILDYLEVNEHFADLYNGSFFEGKNVLDPGELAEAGVVYWDVEPENDLPVENSDRRVRTSERRRDLKKRLKSGNWLCVLAIEHQSGVDYTMAWRHMYYDALEYKKQIKEIDACNEKKMRGQGQKYQRNGYTEKEKLVPVFTLCLYLGEEPWTGKIRNFVK